MRFVFLIAFLMLAAPLQAEPLRVLVSIAPVAGLVERLAGEEVEVDVLLPANADPHHYEPTPRRLRTLENADLVVWVGVPYEWAWKKRAAELGKGIDFLVLAESEEHHRDHHHHHHDHDHEGGEDDPHRWLSPAELREMATKVRDKLIALRPAKQVAIEAGFAKVDGDLAQLQQQIKAALDPMQQRHFLVFHPSWGHFAKEFDLHQMAIEKEGKVPGARGLAERIKHARELGIRRIFVQPQFDRRAAKTVADALNADVVQVDPLGVDTLTTLKTFADKLAEVGTVE